MGFKVTNDAVGPSEQNISDSKDLYASPPEQSAPPAVKDEYFCINKGKGPDVIFKLCAPAGDGGPFSSKTSSAEKELFCDMLAYAMETGEAVPSSWISACEAMLKED